MKLLTTLVVVAHGQNYDYDFYTSGEAYRFGSVGAGSTFADTQPAVQEDGWTGPINTITASSDTDAHNDSQAAHLNGIYADSVRYKSFGHGGNRRYCHTTRNNRAVYNWTSHKYGGYFAEGRNFMECTGEELYCFIEERAHYGQIIGITAGCEQMMNHPSVTIQDQQALISSSYTQINAIKNNYNQEAARGGANRHGFFTYYGLGGCLAMPAQNGHHMIKDRERPPARHSFDLRNPESHRQGVDSDSWRSYKWLNYYRNFHGGYGQNQCLRFPKQRLQDSEATTVTPGVSCGTDSENATVVGQSSQDLFTGITKCWERVNKSQVYNSPGNLLPFGVSVCRACCVAEFANSSTFVNNAGQVYIDTDNDTTSMLCNYPPDTDENIYKETNNQFEEIIPRFDMAGAAYNAFQKPNQNNKQYNPDQDNNLFVHGSWCTEAGPGRGCARYPKDWDRGTAGSANDRNYIYGTDLSTDSYATTLEWGYTCRQRPIQGKTSGTYVGLQPIGARENRDWCPGRPWLANAFGDDRHYKPTDGVNNDPTVNNNVIIG